MNFENLDYLKTGSYRQRQAYLVLTKNQIVSRLKQFDPILVGTIPIKIDIENSDLDIICCFSNKQDFIEAVTNNFKTEKKFAIRELDNLDGHSIVVNFFIDNFEIEIFGQSTPTKQQLAYRHLLIENNLLNYYGEKLKQQIIELKRQGYKTEPAFAKALELKGDPYIELLKFEKNDNGNNF